MCGEEFDPRRAVRSQWRKLAESYTEFRKSPNRYNELIEVPAMRGLLGDVAGLDVLDAGCGTGAQTRYCARNGANVVGVDISHRLLVEARKLAAEEGFDIDYVEGDIEDLGMFRSGRFDAVVSSVVLAFHLEKVFTEFNRVLRPGARLHLSDLHPMFHCGRGEVRDGRQSLVVSGYFDRTVRSVASPFGKVQGGEDVIFYWQHHPLHDYFEALAASGFVVERYLEPQPSRDDGSVKAERANSYPVFFLIKARKERGV